MGLSKVDIWEKILNQWENVYSKKKKMLLFAIFGWKYPLLNEVKKKRRKRRDLSLVRCTQMRHMKGKSQVIFIHVQTFFFILLLNLIFLKKKFFKFVNFVIYYKIDALLFFFYLAQPMPILELFLLISRVAIKGNVRERVEGMRVEA